MKKYIFVKKLIHIIDSNSDSRFFKNALSKSLKPFLGGKLLVVSTKKQASEQISDLAKKLDDICKLQVVRWHVNKLEYNTKFY